MTAPLRTRKAVIAGWCLNGFVSLFLVFDLAMKIFSMQQAVDATTQLGYKASMLPPLGIVQVALLILLLIPRTALIGAVLWTGYLGGAVATHVRAGSPAFETMFPTLVAAMIWGGLWLRDTRVSSMLAAPSAQRS
jgi:hypothetical protein